MILSTEIIPQRGRWGRQLEKRIWPPDSYEGLAMIVFVRIIRKDEMNYLRSLECSPSETAKMDNPLKDHV